ncbi:ABC transporter substrate-binding protein [Microbispora triticiradicis]|uniref:ABC transporter substrate-binding protein n=3 Tax=Microbispora TaxID=2005 RepID=A0ABY3LWN5_9ACTN|nr:MULTISPECIES: ABC transporter substrate-binding protein [Microbispora]GLW24716.1 ABC transporter substrate-binding protein [Microbispora amethystogenes]MBO4274093.1 extracellular solute-binding protein [Microbispora triticiradicis]RGA00606.1 ABC transporter substrate-binding protein [Microbispora triticiradicis]TLP55662.1 ABC transporter substrate-binding protein [Microbispora fusca]TYB57350.1 ABC transporter substrate-binding protein [Microbispora tritici]
MVRRAVAVLAAFLVAGCAGLTDTGAGPTTGTGGTGPITLAIGRDTTAYLRPLLDRWNQGHPDERVTLLELPEASDEQRAQMVANLQARNDVYDVLALDVMWTAEFADAGWIVPLDRSLFPLDKLLGGVADTAIHRDRLWAAPYTSNAGLLYYRSDILKKEHLKPPRTWAELRDQARRLGAKYHIGGYAGQFLPYEGLTVNFAEAVQSAGGSILSPDARTVTMDLGSARAALGFLVGGVKEGWIPREALTYKEEESRLAFQEGRLLFARNWPHAYGPATHSPLAGKFAVTRLPGLNGPGSSSLGGYNLAVSAFSKRQKSALDFIRYFTGRDNERLVLTEGSFPPVWADLYDDPELIRRFPYLPVLKEAILSARPRPVTAGYNQVSLVISSAVSGALALAKPVDETVADLKQGLGEVIQPGG